MIKKIVCILLVLIVALWIGNKFKKKQFFEFKIDCPDEAIPCGVFFSEYEEKEIVVCIFYNQNGTFVFHGYDFTGNQLEISSEYFEDKFANIAEFQRSKMAIVSTELIENEEIGVFYRCDSDEQVGDSRRERENLKWKHHISYYTDYDKYWYKDYLPGCKLPFRFYREWNQMYPFYKKKISPIAFLMNTSGVHQIWGINYNNGEEVFSLFSGKKTFLHAVYIDSNMQHMVTISYDPSTPAEHYGLGISFFQSIDDFVNNKPTMEYGPSNLSSPYIGEENAFFVNDDLFCFAREGGNMRTHSQKYYVDLYSFSKNKIIAEVKLNKHFSNPCYTWGVPWCDISRDGSKMAVGFVRKFSYNWDNSLNSVKKNLFVGLYDIAQ